MNCLYCDEELKLHDYYGRGNPFRSDFVKIGDIFKCENEECEAFDEHFYTDQNDELFQGYPC